MKINLLTKCKDCGSKNNLHKTVDKEILCGNCLDYHRFCTSCNCLDHQDLMTEIDGEYYCSVCDQ
jgi:hypothetical protein